MFCYESSLDGFYEPRRASPDGCNINDDKTLNNLLRVSNFYRPDPKYLETKQEYCFTERMRCQLIDWMYGVSSHFLCCFFLAIFITSELLFRLLQILSSYIYIESKLFQCEIYVKINFESFSKSHLLSFSVMYLSIKIFQCPTELSTHVIYYAIIISKSHRKCNRGFTVVTSGLLPCHLLF